MVERSYFFGYNKEETDKGEKSMKYKVIFFDLDNTLLDFDRSELYALEKTVEAVGYPYSEDVCKIYNFYNNRLWDALEKGEVDLATLKVQRFSELLEHLKVDYDATEMSKLYVSNLGEKAFEMQGAYEICQLLSKKYKLAIVTNGITLVQKNRLAQASFMPFISQVFISEEIGISKPNPGIFEYAIEKMEINKDEVLMVGDSLSSDMQGSINAGIDCCFLNPKGIEKKLEVTYEIKDLMGLRDLLG